MLTEVVGSGGVRLGLRVAGAERTPAIVLVHGWAQSSLAWSAQLADPDLAERFRLVAVDLRGHGNSDVPVEGYDDSLTWATDLAAVLDFAGAGAPVVLVGWSYGGLVIADYLRHHGTEGVAGIVLAGAITEIGRDRPGGATGPAMRAALPAALSDDPAVAVPALTMLSAHMAAEPVDGALAQALLGTSLSVPPRVRGALFRRKVDSGEVLAGIDVPALVVHGDADEVVDPSAGEYAAGKIPGARRRWFEGAGHLPFVERAAEFNDELRRFAEQLLPGASQR
ncbi:alpha/beta fold hydrolase [Amycolatopsis suaedae]|uniref:Alpha/beta hydrolase n=1 Tax=Amycolatopsis suaedae TaxID=2510978 RepID=A0A4Q7JAM3_9PSEU|nr:alpha/beta hydrolase [Amycolatopsis suaedae]RZQ64317.1 alpha/beta hydrolase [Amycolatopsis suaedae]